MTAKQLKDELDIKDNTLKRWEENGLKRYQPPPRRYTESLL